MTNSFDNSVSVIDVSGNRNTILATVPVGFGPEGVAVNLLTNKIYIANGTSNTVSVIDGANNTVLTTVSVGTFPRGVVVNHALNRTYVTNSSNASVSVIDNANNTVVATIKLCGAWTSGGVCSWYATNPIGIAASQTLPRVYVANINGYWKSGISIIDVNTNTVIAWKMAPTNNGQQSTGGIAVSSASNKVFSTVNNVGTGTQPRFYDGVKILDTNTNSIVGQILTGFNFDPVGISVIE